MLQEQVVGTVPLTGLCNGLLYIIWRPGFIFLMLVCGLNFVVGTGYCNSLGLNSVLIFIFLLVSILTERTCHLLASKALSLIYAGLMLGTMVQLGLEAFSLRGTCSLAPSAFSLLLIGYACFLIKH